MQAFIKQLHEGLKAPLPGLEAQLIMMSSGLKKTNREMYLNIAEGAKKAAVMLLLFQKNEEWYTTLMQRPESPYAHSKQVSFPGGGVEDIDNSLKAAALRETEEEFGIPREDIRVIGRLSQLYIPVSNYLVHPFVGYLAKIPSYIPDPNEVDEIIEVKVDDLLNPNLRKITQIKTSSGLNLKNVPYFDVNNKVVWGATAMMLSEFIELIKRLKS